MPHLSHYIICTLILTCTACETMITYQGETAEPKLVLHATLWADDSAIETYLGRSLFFLDQPKMSDYAIGDAQFSYQLGQDAWFALTPDDTAQGAHYTYRSPLPRPARPGDSLHLKASRDGYPSIRVDTRIPLRPAMGTITYTGDTAQRTITLSIPILTYTDPDVCLGIAAYALRDDSVLGNTISSHDMRYASANNDFDTEHGYRSNTELRFLPSSLRGNDTTSITLHYQPFYDDKYSPLTLPHCVIVTLTAYSYDSYRYLCSMQSYNGDVNYNDWDFGAIISAAFNFGQQEKSPIFSNVTNGFGIVITGAADIQAVNTYP